MFSNQDKFAGYATLFGAMLLAISISVGAFLLRGFVPPFILVVFPAIIGAGLMAAGLVAKRDNGWSHHEAQPERRA
jgi:hypothetical protein